MLGVVVTISPESKRSGKSEIKVNEKFKFRYIYYTFVSDQYDIEIGDSLIKRKDSDILFVKSIRNGTLRKANDQNYL